MAIRIRAETYMPRAMAVQQAKKLVGASGDKTLGTPAERDQALSSLFPAWRSDAPLDSRRSYASFVAPRPTPKPAEDPKPKWTAVKPTIQDIVGPSKRDEGPTQSDNPNNLSLIKDLKETVEALRKELKVERAARKKLNDDMVRLRLERQEARSILQLKLTFDILCFRTYGCRFFLTWCYLREMDSTVYRMSLLFSKKKVFKFSKSVAKSSQI